MLQRSKQSGPVSAWRSIWASLSVGAPVLFGCALLLCVCGAGASVAATSGDSPYVVTPPPNPHAAFVKILLLDDGPATTQSFTAYRRRSTPAVAEGRTTFTNTQHKERRVVLGLKAGVSRAE